MSTIKCVDELALPFAEAAVLARSSFRCVEKSDAFQRLFAVQKLTIRKCHFNYNPDKLFPNVIPPVRLVAPGCAPNPVNPVIAGCFIAFGCPNDPNADGAVPKPPNAGGADDPAAPKGGAPNPVAGFCPARKSTDLYEW